MVSPASPRRADAKRLSKWKHPFWIDTLFMIPPSLRCISVEDRACFRMTDRTESGMPEVGRAKPALVLAAVD